MTAFVLYVGCGNWDLVEWVWDFDVFFNDTT